MQSLKVRVRHVSLMNELAKKICSSSIQTLKSDSAVFRICKGSSKFNSSSMVQRRGVQLSLRYRRKNSSFGGRGADFSPSSVLGGRVT